MCVFFFFGGGEDHEISDGKNYNYQCFFCFKIQELNDNSESQHVDKLVLSNV